MDSSTCTRYFKTAVYNIVVPVPGGGNNNNIVVVSEFTNDRAVLLPVITVPGST